MSNTSELQDLVYSIFRLNDLLKEAADHITAPSGQSGARWQVLNALAEGPQTVAEIARMKGLARQSIQRLADVLAAEKVVEFRPNPLHQKAQLVVLTRKGQRVHQDILHERDLWLKDLQKKLSVKDLTQAKNFLHECIRVLREEEKP